MFYQLFNSYTGVIEVSIKDKIYEQNILTNVLSIIQYIGVIEVSIKDKIYEQNILTKRFINYSIICIGMIEVSIKDKIYEQNILTNVLSIIQ